MSIHCPSFYTVREPLLSTPLHSCLITLTVSNGHNCSFSIFRNERMQNIPGIVHIIQPLAMNLYAQDFLRSHRFHVTKYSLILIFYAQRKSSKPPTLASSLSQKIPSRDVKWKCKSIGDTTLNKDQRIYLLE